MTLRSVTVLAALQLATACGDDGGAAVDARRQDAADHDARPADAQAADAPADAVFTVVTQNNAPLEHARVYFQAADSTLVSEQFTDAQGVAAAEMPGDGFVTIIIEAGGSSILYTISAPQAGEHLHVDFDSTSTLTPIHVHVTAPTFAGAQSYRIATTCGGEADIPSGTADITLLAPCPTTDVAVYATTAVGDPLSVAYLPDAAVTEGATLVVPAAYSTAGATAITLTDLPASFTGFELDGALITAHGQLYGAPSTHIDATAGSASGSFLLPVAPGATELLLPLPLDGATPQVFWTLYDYGAQTSAFSLDVGAALPHRVTSPATIDVPDHTVQWTEDTAHGVAGDVDTVAMTVTRGSSTRWVWNLVAAHTGASLALPILPSDSASLNPLAGDTSVITVDRLVQPGGYDATYREAAFSAAPAELQGYTGLGVLEELPGSTSL